MKKLIVRLVLVGLASIFLWISSLILSFVSVDWIFAVKASLAVIVLLLICLAWVCFTVWFMLELQTAIYSVEKFFKKVVDSLSRKR